jgi:hypothetical protein
LPEQARPLSYQHIDQTALRPIVLAIAQPLTICALNIENILPRIIVDSFENNTLITYQTYNNEQHVVNKLSVL